MCGPLKSWDSKTLLLDYLRQNTPNVIIGCAVEAPRGYYSCSVGDVDLPLHVGVIVNQFKAPSILPLPKVQRAILGYDQSFVVIDCRSASLQQVTQLDGVFFQFLRAEERQQILALHELGVVAISEEGKELWRYTTNDILEGWMIVDNNLILTVMDSSSPVSLMLASGASTHDSSP